MRWAEVVEGWKSDPRPRDALRRRLLAVEEPSVVWETSRSLDGTEAYQEWIGAKPSLASRRASPRAFAEHLGPDVCSFPNLGGRSMLVCPPVTGDYGHLLAFAREAPDPVWHALWQEVAVQIGAWWDGPRGPLWVSTHGGGVPWLHVRLDPNPKYYQGPMRTLGSSLNHPV